MNTLTADHIKRYTEFLFSSRKTLSIKLGKMNKVGLDYVLDASKKNNQFRKAVPQMAHAVIRSYVSRKEVSPGVFAVTAVFDKR